MVPHDYLFPFPTTLSHYHLGCDVLYNVKGPACNHQSIDNHNPTAGGKLGMRYIKGRAGLQIRRHLAWQPSDALSLLHKSVVCAQTHIRD